MAQAKQASVSLAFISLSQYVALSWMLIETDGQSSNRKNSTRSPCTSRGGRKLGPTWKYTSRCWQDVIWLLSGSSTSPIFRALICKLICGWQLRAWVWERILDVIRCLIPSWFVDWSLIGKESAAFPLWGKQGRWQLEHMDREWVFVIFLYNTEVQTLRPTASKRRQILSFLYVLAYSKQFYFKQAHEDEWNVLLRYN